MDDVCKKCRQDAAKRLVAAELARDLQALISGLEKGEATGSHDAKPFLIGLLVGIATASGLSVGNTPAEASEFTDRHSRMLAGLSVLSRNYQAGRINKPHLGVYMQPWDGKDSDLAIPEELKWKPG